MNTVTGIGTIVFSIEPFFLLNEERNHNAN